MRVGFVVNDIATETDTFTTTRLAMTAVNRGHEAWLIGAGDLAFDPDDHVRARARTVTKRSYKSNKLFLEELRGPKGRSERITVDDVDVLVLRSDPASEKGKREWAQLAGINFGRAAMRRGVDASTVTPQRRDASTPRCVNELTSRRLNAMTPRRHDAERAKRALANQQSYDAASDAMTP